MANVDDSGLHERDDLVSGFSPRGRTDFAGADREGLTGILHRSDSQEVIPKRGAHKVDLELGGDDIAIRWRPGQRCVPTRRVDDGRDCPSMKIAVLLRKCLGEGQCDVHLAIRYQGKLCPECRHQALRIEAGRDSIVDFVHGEAG